MEKTRIPVPVDVMEGLEAVRISGKTNMFDVPVVERLALEMGFPEAAIWVRENRRLYAQGIIRGFQPTDKLDENLVHEMAESAIDPEGSDEECADR